MNDSHAPNALNDGRRTILCPKCDHQWVPKRWPHYSKGKFKFVKIMGAIQGCPKCYNIQTLLIQEAK